MKQIILVDDYFEPILYIPVPQTGHLPFIAGLPFFIVTCSGLATSLLARHLTQYIVAINFFHPLLSFRTSDND